MARQQVPRHKVFVSFHHEAVRDIRQWIHLAFQKRSGVPPVNNRPQFGRNRSGDCRAGWRD